MATAATGYGAGKLPAFGAHLMSSGFYTATMSGNLTLDMGFQNFIKLDPAGARDVTLPAEEGNNGAWFFICNAADGAETITVKNDAAATVVALPQNRAAIVTCDGSSWAHMGIITIALS